VSAPGGAAPPPAAVRDALGRARDLGFLGPGPLEPQITHATGFVEVLEDQGVPDDALVVDLGSGGGLPGLVILAARPRWRAVLLEVMVRRAAFLRQSIQELGWGDRAEVVQERAEVAGRGPLRGSASGVVARSFGPPAATAECAAPFLRVGGVLVVSEPPDDRPRWSEEGLARLGLRLAGSTVAPYHFRWFEQVHECPQEFPRSVGRPRKRPLF
jgi:16S rRNA (guanine527-N7)-methyltransferase